MKDARASQVSDPNLPVTGPVLYPGIRVSGIDL
jgi:hypothetical protein